MGPRGRSCRGAAASLNTALEGRRGWEGRSEEWKGLLPFLKS